MRHLLEYFLALVFAKFLCLIPRRLALGLGSVLGWCGWYLGIRKELVLSNIARARPGASMAELKKIGRHAAANFGRTTAEFIRYGIKDRDLISEHFEIRGLEALERSLAQGKGAIVLTGHFGAWAIYFAAISMQGIPLSLLVGRQHNKRIDQFILKIPGDRVEFISKGRAAVKKILNKLGEGRAVVMVADQNAGRHGVVVPFLGEDASTLPLPGSFAIKYHVPVFIMSGHRRDDGTHLVEIKELSVQPKETEEEKKIEVLRSYNEEMGKIIADKPEQYFWYHRRWRTGKKKSRS